MSEPAGMQCDALCPCQDPCPIRDAVSMIGGKWKMRILCSLSVDGMLRYNELKQRTNGITPAMLSSSLKDLETDGIIVRKQYDGIPARVEYSLTDYGKELWPILHRLAHWARHEAFDEE